MSRKFNDALSNFSFDVTAKKAIRHLYDEGFLAEDIQKELLYPVPLKRIEREIEEYAEEKEQSDADYEFVKEYDSYGHASFIKKKIGKQV